MSSPQRSHQAGWCEGTAAHSWPDPVPEPRSAAGTAGNSGCISMASHRLVVPEPDTELNMLVTMSGWST